MKTDITHQAKRISALVLDVDGVLTTGTIYYGLESVLVKGFNLHDGMGIKLLQKGGLSVAIISAKESTAVRKRAQELGINLLYLGQEHKLSAYEQLKKSLAITDAEVCYVGDDLPDLPILTRAGLAITVPKACDLIKQHAHYITTRQGGEGAVREVCEILLKAQGLFETVIQSYLV